MLPGDPAGPPFRQLEARLQHASRFASAQRVGHHVLVPDVLTLQLAQPLRAVGSSPSSRATSRSLRTICSGVCLRRLTMMSSPTHRRGLKDTH